MREPISHGGYGTEALTSAYPYLLAGDDAPEYAQLWNKALSLRALLSKRWVLAESRAWQRRVPCWPARLLVKEVNCLLALEWLAATFGFRIVVTIRHPCGFVASGLRVVGEGYRFVSHRELLRQPLLANRYFPDQEWLMEIEDPVGQMAAWYGMVYKVLGDQLMHHPEWILVQHEALCADPNAQFRRLFEALGITYLDRVNRYLVETSTVDDGRLYSVYRETGREPAKWKRELSAGQIERVAEVIERFRLPFYRDFA
jgi:hypothetical protein